MPAARYGSSRSANQANAAAASSGSSAAGRPSATARSQPCTRWSANSCIAYSAPGTSPKLRCTVSAIAPGAPPAARAPRIASCQRSSGTAPSWSPSSRSPTSAMVRPANSSAAHRSSTATWFTSVRTVQPGHGVGSFHCGSRIPATSSSNRAAAWRSSSSAPVSAVIVVMAASPGTGLLARSQVTLGTRVCGFLATGRWVAATLTAWSRRTCRSACSDGSGRRPAAGSCRPRRSAAARSARCWPCSPSTGTGTSRTTHWPTRSGRTRRRPIRPATSACSSTGPAGHSVTRA